MESVAPIVWVVFSALFEKGGTYAMHSPEPPLPCVQVALPKGAAT